MTELLEKYNIITDSFWRHFKFLIQKGYSLTAITSLLEDNPPKYCNLSISLSNENLGQRIEFIFRPFSSAPENKEVNLVAFYIKKENKSIRLDQYVKQFWSDQENIVSLNQYKDKMFSDQIQLYFNYAEKFILYELTEIIEGKKWIDISFDWDQYK